MSKHTHLWLLLGLGVLAGCGDNDDLVCETGTFRSGDDCVAADPNDKTAPVTAASPAGAKQRSLPGFVVLSSDEEGVTIHYTLDGSEPTEKSTGELSPVLLPTITSGTTIKYFGVDPSGNVEATHTETYDLDLTGPAAVTGMAVSGSGQTTTVTWTNPTDADYAGTLVARIDGVLDAGPIDGQTYAPAAALSPSIQVVSAGATTTFSEVRPAGSVRYVAWAYDDLLNYSPPVYVSTTIGTIDTAATYTFDTTNSVLALTTTPPSVDLTGTTADLAAGTVTLHLTIKNVTATYFQNPKVIVTSTTNATVANEDGTVDGDEYFEIGPGYFAPGATKQLDLEFGSATGTVTIELALREDPSLIGGWHKGCCSGKPHRLLDSATGAATEGLVFSTGGRDPNRRGGISRPGINIGTHYLDIPTSEASIERWDMVTQTKVGGTSIAVSNNTSIMTLLSDGVSEYAVVKRGGIRNSGIVERLVRFDEALKVTGTLPLSFQTHKGFTLSAISPDGKYIAIPANQSIVVVDLATFAVKDMNPSTPAVDVITNVFTNGDSIRSVTFTNGSATLVAVGFNGAIGVVKTTSSGFTVLTPVLTGARGNAVERTPDGRVWIAVENSLRYYDPSTDAITPTAYSPGAYALKVVKDQLWVLRSGDRRTLDRVNDSGVVQQTIVFSQQTYGHWIGATTN
jgi:hypothetical protein